MADLKIPNLNMKYDKYIFKKKLSLRRKSKKRLFVESALMFILSLFLIYLNILIPNKNSLLQNLPKTLDKSFKLFVDLLSNLYEIFLIVFILISMLISLILFIGAFYRIFRVVNRKTKRLN